MPWFQPSLSAARRQDTTWWTGRSRSSRWIPEPSLISDPSEQLCVDCVRILCLSWFKVYPQNWWGSLMIIISSDKSFISEVSLATSLGWHSPPTIVLFERTYFLLRREMNCKKWLAVQDQDAVSLNIIVYIEWVVQVSSAHPVSSTDIHWQKVVQGSNMVIACLCYLCKTQSMFLYVLIPLRSDLLIYCTCFPPLLPVSSCFLTYLFCKCPFLPRHHLFPTFFVFWSHPRSWLPLSKSQTSDGKSLKTAFKRWRSLRVFWNVLECLFLRKARQLSNPKQRQEKHTKTLINFYVGSVGPGKNAFWWNLKGNMMIHLLILDRAPIFFWQKPLLSFSWHDEAWSKA